MNATLTPTGAENLSALTTPDTLQEAFDQIAILHGANDNKTEVIDIAFGELHDLKSRIEKLEKFL
jgi:hypothetical protein